MLELLMISRQLEGHLVEHRTQQRLEMEVNQIKDKQVQTTNQPLQVLQILDHQIKVHQALKLTLKALTIQPKPLQPQSQLLFQSQLSDQNTTQA